VDITAADDVLAVLKPIWSTKAETASRVRGRIEKVLDAAKAKGFREGENPARWRGHLAMRWINAASLWKRGRPIASRRPCANSEPEVAVTLTVPLLFGYVRTCSLSSLGNGDDAQETENSIFSFGSLARNKPT
jgi:hypothetical protein